MTAAIPWTDRSGRFSALRALVFAAAVLPGAMLAVALATGHAGPNPYDYAIRDTGEWTVRFLLATLAVTPLRRIFAWNRLIAVRRMLGLTALAYALIHLGLYVLQQNADLAKVVTEIALRTYLTIGFVALAILVLLGATSTDAAIRRLGRRWTRLHQLVYPAAALGLLHEFLQTKADVFVPTVYAGLFLLLMAVRIAHAAGARLSAPVVAGLALASGAATMGLEWLWYATATGIPAERVFYANASLAAGLRPGWWIAIAGLGVAAAALVRTATGGPGAVTPRRGSSGSRG